MGWIKNRIDEEYKKHKKLDWSKIAEAKIKSEINVLIDNLENPYPIDVFPKLSEFDLEMITRDFEDYFRISVDRFSAELMRRARDNLKHEIKDKILDGEGRYDI